MPSLPVNSILLSLSSPPEFCTQGLHFFVERSRNSKTRHDISGDCLNNDFDKDFPPPLREEYVFPTTQFLCHPVSQVGKLDSFTSEGEGRESQIDGMALANRKVQLVLNILDVRVIRIWTERDSRFVKINFLARGFLIVFKSYFD